MALDVFSILALVLNTFQLSLLKAAIIIVPTYLALRLLGHVTDVVEIAIAVFLAAFASTLTESFLPGFLLDPVVTFAVYYYLFRHGLKDLIVLTAIAFFGGEILSFTSLLGVFPTIIDVVKQFLPL